MQCSRLHLLPTVQTQLNTVSKLCNYWLGFNTEAQLSTPTIESDQKMLDFETTNQNEMINNLNEHQEETTYTERQHIKFTPRHHNTHL